MNDNEKIFDMQRYVGIPDFNPTHTLHVKFGVNPNPLKKSDPEAIKKRNEETKREAGEAGEAGERRPGPVEGLECGCGGIMTIEDTTYPPINVWWDGPQCHEDDTFALVELDLVFIIPSFFLLSLF